MGKSKENRKEKEKSPRELLNQISEQLTDTAGEMLYGLLLGKGFLLKRSDGKVVFQYLTDDKPYLEWMRNMLVDNGVSCESIHSRVMNVGDEFTSMYILSSTPSEQLQPMYRYWYSDLEEEKHIPEQVPIVPMTIRQWYFSNALESSVVNIGNKRDVFILLCDTYTRENVDRFVDQLNESVSSSVGRGDLDKPFELLEPVQRSGDWFVRIPADTYHFFYMYIEKADQKYKPTHRYRYIPDWYAVEQII